MKLGSELVSTRIVSGRRLAWCGVKWIDVRLNGGYGGCECGVCGQREAWLRRKSGEQTTKYVVY